MPRNANIWSQHGQQCNHYAQPTDLNQLQPLLQNGGSLTITFPPVKRESPIWGSWAPQWEWFVFRLKERAKIGLLAEEYKELSTDINVMQECNRALLEQNDALALRLQFLIREGRRCDLRKSDDKWEKEEGVQTEQAGLLDYTSNNDCSELFEWLTLLDSSIALVDHGLGRIDFPFRFLVYDTRNQLRQRIIKVDCGPDVDPNDVEIESRSNWCRVKIPTSTGAKEPAFQKEFLFKDSEFLFEFKEDQMQIQGATVMVLVFDATPTIKRIARFPRHSGELAIEKNTVSPALSSWNDIEDLRGGDHAEVETNEDAHHSEDDDVDNLLTDDVEKKKKRSHRQRKRRQDALRQIPRTPSSSAAIST